MRNSAAIVVGLLLTGGTVWAQQYVITTVAGGGLPPTPASATTASIPVPYAVTVDAAGNLYFTAANAVFKVAATGVLTRVAGSTRAGYSGDGGLATSAQLNAPKGVVADGAGNLFISDTSNHAIRKVAANGVITTVAGNGTPGHTGDGGQATAAQLYYPMGVALDAAGNLYIADSFNAAIRKVAATTGTITTLAGSAGLDGPGAVALDAAGDLCIADTYNSVVRKLAANGTVTTVAGGSTSGYSGDGGPATAAQLHWPSGVALDAAGNLYIADSLNNAIRKVAANGIITTVAGGGAAYPGDGGPATAAQLDWPRTVAVDASGNLYIADGNDHAVRKVVANGIISTVAGNGSDGYSGDGGPATGAQLSYANGSVVDAAGNLYIADGGNNVIRRVAVDGTITTVAGNGTYGYSGDGGPATMAQLDWPQSVALDASGNLYVADTANAVVRKVAANTGMITTVAGNGVYGYTGDGGLAPQARLNGPYGVAVDSAGNLFVADTWNNAIRKVAANGVITTVATGTQLGGPQGIAVDSAGNLFIADSNNSMIRRVAVNGTTVTVAGTGSYGYSGDGGPATSARLSIPTGVGVDAAGNLFIADTWNAAIRKVAANGAVTTVAGSGGSGSAGDGGPAMSAQFTYPQGVAVDSSGNVYVTDQFVVRVLAPQGARAVLSVAHAQSAGFAEGQTGAAYSVVVSNGASGAPSGGTVTVTEIVPPGLTLVSMSGLGWNCSGNTCTRSDALGPGSSFPPITVVVNVAASTPFQVIDEASVSGGGAVATSASNAMDILGGGGTPAAPVLVSPANGATGVPLAPALTWNAASGATSYDVYFGTLSTPPLVTNTAGTSYAPGALSVGTTHYWQITARNDSGFTSSGTWSFTTGGGSAGLLFVPVTPCRVADTRVPFGLFGNPTMAAGEARSFPIPQAACNIPATAQAYSLNVTVVPYGPLHYLTLWPAGQPEPFVSTLNSWDGTVVANAAIVAAGVYGAVSVFVTDEADVILDIDGYFASAGAANASSFYPATPCRIADTRNLPGLFGGPSMYGGQKRDFPVPLGACGIPALAAAYSLNVTAVPDQALGWLAAWATGSPQPWVSTLNSWNGRVVANEAIVPAGSNGSISVYVTDPTDVILDIDGYFGQPGGEGALSLYPVWPCRVADTRRAPGPFGGPEMLGGTARSFPIPAGGCSIPSTAAAYSVNVTVVPDGPLAYLSAWPTGSPMPIVSTLNSFDGSVVANAAIIPAGTNGSIDIYVSNSTHVILDIDGYFAP